MEIDNNVFKRYLNFYPPNDNTVIIDIINVSVLRYNNYKHYSVSYESEETTQDDDGVNTTIKRKIGRVYINSIEFKILLNMKPQVNYNTL